VTWFLAGFLFFSSPRPIAQEGFLPNRKVTPGRVAANERERSGISVETEKKVFARYKLQWSARQEFKIDHLIPRELGGADTVDNLWPQPVRARPYSVERNELLAAVMLEEIKRGRITIEQAREEIRRDWIDAFIDHVGMVYLK